MVLNKGDVITQKVTGFKILIITLLAVIFCCTNLIATTESSDIEDNPSVELKATIANNGYTDVIFDVYFTADREKIEGSTQTIKIDAGGQTDLTYNCKQSGYGVEYGVSTDNGLILSVSNFDEIFNTLEYNIAVMAFILLSTVFLMVFVYKYCRNLGKGKRRR